MSPPTTIPLLTKRNPYPSRTLPDEQASVKGRAEVFDRLFAQAREAKLPLMFATELLGGRE
jgi:hypothetical protein